MALLLSLETSSYHFSCALHQDDKLLAVEYSQQPQSAAAQLTMAIQSLFSKTNLQLHDLDAVVISRGPGSYTGLRIGTSTAKGICQAIGAKLISVGTLDLLAAMFAQTQSVWKKGDWLCPMLDARRLEVYSQWFDHDAHPVGEVKAVEVNAESFQQELDERVIWFFGDGAMKCKPLLQHANARFVEGVSPSAEWLGPMGFKKWQHQQVERLDDFEPFYLKDFVVKKPKLSV